jgi:uncharacterized protein YyaL (SSP411 family)
MYDQLAGGFARYSVDAQWVVPHFEKMLYDNALLLRVYTHLWRATGEPGARRVALETADFLLRDLRTEQGGFASALDADTAGEEGLTYVWTPAQLLDALGDEDGRWAVEQFDVTERGTFEHGSSVLQRLAEPDDAGRYERVCARLREVRAQRPQPGRDDKVVAAWNGLAVAALAEAGALFDRPSLVAAADACADLLGRLHWAGGRLLRTSIDGRPGRHAGVLEDYADVAEGLLVLCSVTGDVRRLAAARGLLDVVLDHFPDGHGGFYDTADDAEQLVRRPQDPTDGPVPSGLAAAAGALLTCAALTGVERYRTAAEAALGTVAPLLGRHARFAGWAAAVGEALLAGPAEVVVLDRPTCWRWPGWPPRPGPSSRRAGRWRTAARPGRRTSAGTSPARRRRRTPGGWPSSSGCAPQRCRADGQAVRPTALRRARAWPAGGPAWLTGPGRVACWPARCSCSPVPGRP